MAMITNDWLDAVKPEFSKEYYKDLFCFVKDEYSKCVVYPPADDIFNAFHFTPLSKVKVLILGQDPYHNDGQAKFLVDFSQCIDKVRSCDRIQLACRFIQYQQFRVLDKSTSQ